MTTSWPTAPAQQQTSGMVPSTRGRLFSLIFAAVAVVVTLAAIVLAVVAPSFTSAPPSPGNWSRQFDGSLNGQSSAVATDQNCQATSAGLHVSADQSTVACDVTAGGSAAIANGFLMTVTLAPASQIAGAQQPFIALGDSGYVAVQQVSTDSMFVICNDACVADSANEVLVGSDAWHGEGYDGNTLTVYWAGSGHQLVVYANGQQVDAVDFSYEQGAHGLGIGAIKDGEALYTHLALYTP